MSLTSVPGKVMEKVVREIMENHLTKHHLITQQQHGFERRKSCLTNLLETIDCISEAWNCGFSSVVVFMDFAKAFDKVCHRALIRKLKAYGFSGCLLDWLTDFLIGRKKE